jgi:hypothetical protein
VSDWYELDENRNVVKAAGYPARRDSWRVGSDTVNGHRVSTVFLGLDHQYGDGPPLVFETMIFPPDSWSEVYCERYSTWAEAEAGHATAIEHAKTLEVTA